MRESEVRQMTPRLLYPPHQRIDPVGELDAEEDLGIANVEICQRREELIGWVGHRRKVDVVHAMGGIRYESVREARDQAEIGDAGTRPAAPCPVTEVVAEDDLVRNRLHQRREIL